MAALRNSLSGQRCCCGPLIPSHDRDADGPQLAEQARAPAVAVEHQRPGAGSLLALPALRQQAHLLQLRHDAVPDLGHDAAVHLTVQAQQRRPTQRVHPVAGRGRQRQLLARHELLGQSALPAVDLHVTVHEQRGDGLRIVLAPILC